MKIEIKPDTMHPETHRLVTVEHRGRVYGIRWAKPWPDEARVMEVWGLDRMSHKRNRTFLPYDSSSDLFVPWCLRP